MPRSTPTRRHFRQFADRKVSLDHAAQADKLEVRGVERGAAKELPISIRVVIDLADRFNAFHDLASSEYASADRKIEGPRMERVGMAHMGPNTRIKPSREAGSA